MKSTFEMICRKALEAKDGYYEFRVDNPNEAVTSIAVGEWSGNWYSSPAVTGFGPTKDSPHTIEMWIHATKNLEEISENFGKLVKEFDDIGYDRDKFYAENGLYEYHFSYVPKAYMADVFPEIYPLDKKEDEEKEKEVRAWGDDGSYVKANKGTLAEFALSHGCDYMDLTTGITYRGGIG